MTFLHGIETVEVPFGEKSLQIAISSTIGIVGTAPAADAAKFPLDKPVLFNDIAQLTDLGEDGTLAESIRAIYKQFNRRSAVLVVVRVEESTNADPDMAEDETIVNVRGDEVTRTGCYAFMDAKAMLGFTPSLLLAPGFTHQDPGIANPVVSELTAVSAKLLSMSFGDCPDDTVTAARQYATDNGGTGRFYCTFPFVKIYDQNNVLVTKPSSPFAAGVAARVDLERGPHRSPSNNRINGIVGTSKPIDARIGDPSSDANLLNEGNVATIIRFAGGQRDGFYLWGNRVSAQEAQWKFFTVRRVADITYRTIEEGLLQFVDEPLNVATAEAIVASVNSLLRTLKSRGWILGGAATLNPTLNTSSSLASGKIYIDYDLEPVAPGEHIIFRASRNQGLYEETFAPLLNAA